MKSGVNKIILLGRLGKNPEIRYVPDNQMKIARFSLATNNRKKNKATGQYEDDTEWHLIVLFGSQADIAEQYLQSGDLIYIEGRIQTRKWENKQGQTTSRTEIIGNTLKMISGKKDREFRDKVLKDGNETVQSKKSEEDSFLQAHHNDMQQRVQNDNEASSSLDFDDDIPF